MAFKESKQSVDEMYKYLVPIATEIVKKESSIIDNIIGKIQKNYDTMSNKNILDYMLQLGAESYFFGTKKDFASLKQACAKALYEEGYAISCTEDTGTVAARANNALINNSDKNAVKLLYDLVSNLMKTKLDETHRMINILNSVIISRNAEAKLKPSYETEDNTSKEEIELN